MAPITPFLWFDTQAEAAARLYVSIFPNSKLGKIAHYPEGAPSPAGSVMTVDFELNGQRFVALNAGPHFKFNEAVSFQIHCETQAEVDAYWDKLGEGGEPGPCGWLKDRFGLSWQVTPMVLERVMGGPDPAKAARVMAAMMKMSKLDVAELEAAAEG